MKRQLSESETPLGPPYKRRIYVKKGRWYWQPVDDSERTPRSNWCSLFALANSQRLVKCSKIYTPDELFALCKKLSKVFPSFFPHILKEGCFHGCNIKKRCFMCEFPTRREFVCTKTPLEKTQSSEVCQTDFRVKESVTCITTVRSLRENHSSFSRHAFVAEKLKTQTPLWTNKPAG